jgi:hypothetical protein
VAPAGSRSPRDHLEDDPGIGPSPRGRLARAGHQNRRCKLARPTRYQQESPLCGLFRWAYWARTSDPQLVDRIAGATSVSFPLRLVRFEALAERVFHRFWLGGGNRRNGLYRLFRHCIGTGTVTNVENKAKAKCGSTIRTVPRSARPFLCGRVSGHQRRTILSRLTVTAVSRRLASQCMSQSTPGSSACRDGEWFELLKDTRSPTSAEA